MTFTSCIFGSSGGSLLLLSAVWRRPRVKCLLQSSFGRGVEVATAVLRSPTRWLSWRCPAATPGSWISLLRMRRIMTSSWCWNSEFTTWAGTRSLHLCFEMQCRQQKECEPLPLRQRPFCPIIKSREHTRCLFHLQSSFSPIGFIRNSLLPYSLYQSSNSELLE